MTRCPKCRGNETPGLYTPDADCDACRGSGEVFQLHDLPSMSPLRVTVNGVAENAVFAWLDGSYSLCYLERDRLMTFHLSRRTPMRKVDGRWETID